MPAPLNQRERADAAMARLHGMLPDDTLEVLGGELCQIVGEAQNDPPDGMSDGTLSPNRWLALAKMNHAVRAMRDAVGQWGQLHD